MARIDYTGADGARHSFDADTASGVFERLSRIKGYLNPQADALTRSLGEGLKSTRAARSAKFAKGLNLGDPYGRRDGYDAQGGGVRVVRVVTGVSIGEDGSLVAELTSLALPDTVRIRGSERVNLGKVKAEATAAAQPDEPSKETLDVVVGSTYSPEEHVFVNKLVTISGVKAVSEYSQTVFTAVPETVSASVVSEASS